MAGERSTQRISVESRLEEDRLRDDRLREDRLPDDRLESVRTEAFAPTVGDDSSSLLQVHLRTSARLVRDGNPERAFAELVRASRAIPMSARLAAAMVRVSLLSGASQAAAALIGGGQDETDGAERVEVRRQLVRLLRRTDELERAREILVLVLAERPQDRRARAVLNALLQREERWEELDASLEREVKEALRRGQLKRAARSTLFRARLWGERLGSPARAALRYGQAAQFADQAGDAEAAFSLRLLWLRALGEAEASERSIDEAVQLLLATAERVGKTARAQALVVQLGLAAAATELLEPAQASRAAQQELLAAAEEAEARGDQPEAAALLAAAVDVQADPAAERRLEAHYVARGAWRELAQLYKDRVARAVDAKVRVDALTKLAELLESELGDLAGAARVYGELVQLTGDKRALHEQVRLLSAREDTSGVRQALNAAVDHASAPNARADALVARGEAALSAGDGERARRDFSAARQIDPGHLPALAALAELDARAGNRDRLLELKQRLRPLPRRHPLRAPLFRRVARLANLAPADLSLARGAWGEVLAELPQDEEAQSALTDIARLVGDDVQLEQLLRAQVRREPRGPATRLARLELVALLERAGQKDSALQELRQAVRFEPGHKEAWYALADRLVARGVPGEAAWALEQAATATQNPTERMHTWRRLAGFSREVLKDERKARLFDTRARNIRASLDEERQASRKDAEPITEDGVPVLTPGASREVTTAETSAPGADPGAVPGAVPVEVTTGDLLPRLTGAAPPGEGPADELRRHAERAPLDPDGYSRLAEAFDSDGHAERAALLRELAAALRDQPWPAPELPRLILSPIDRAGLRHPSLRCEAGEMLGLAGVGLCRLFPGGGKQAPRRPPFGLEAGKGALAAADALMAAVRVLGLRAPDVFISDEVGPPFALVFDEAPRLLVGKMAVQRALTPGELRFFAGRALFTQTPDLMVLRSLTRDQLARGLSVLGGVVSGARNLSVEAKALRDALPARGADRLRELYQRVGKGLDLKGLSEAARHSANRAGLVVCGGLAPALQALRSKKALESEMAELLRFAASDRYAELRRRMLRG